MKSLHFKSWCDLTISCGHSAHQSYEQSCQLPVNVSGQDSCRYPFVASVMSSGQLALFTLAVTKKEGVCYVVLQSQPVRCCCLLEVLVLPLLSYFLSYCLYPARYPSTVAADSLATRSASPAAQLLELYSSIESLGQQHTNLNKIVLSKSAFFDPIRPSSLVSSCTWPVAKLI